MTDYADWTKNLIADIRANGRPTSGPFEGRSVMVLTTIGAKSGEPRTVVVTFSRDGDDYIVVGSKSGGPQDPAWFTNLVANPVVTVETDRHTFQASATVAEGADRDTLWDRHMVEHAQFADYPSKTDRIIPIARLTPAADSTKRAAEGDVPITLPAAMTGRASPAKAAVGDKPVFAYISGLPQPQRAIAERIDALAAKTLPALQRSVKWGMAWYGVGEGWCFACGGFAGHVKLAFGRGTSLTPVPPVTPIGMGKDTRGVDLGSVDDIDERLVASWMEQAAAMPGFGGKKR